MWGARPGQGGNPRMAPSSLLYKNKGTVREVFECVGRRTKVRAENVLPAHGRKAEGELSTLHLQETKASADTLEKAHRQGDKEITMGRNNREGPRQETDILFSGTLGAEEQGGNSFSASY